MKISPAARPFRVDIAQARLDDLRERVAETGGHFAALELGPVLVEEVRSLFRNYR